MGRATARRPASRPPIHHDLLPPGEEAQRMLLGAGFSDVWVEDTSAHYLASGQRPA